jgi:hypothetical protein
MKLLSQTAVCPNYYDPLYTVGFSAGDDCESERERIVRAVGQLVFQQFLEMSIRNAVEMDAKPAKLEVVPTSQILEESRRVLGASISDLAQMLGVSRPTIYSYLEGNEPSGSGKDFSGRLTLLKEVVQLVKEAHLPVPCSTLLRRKDVCGKTLKESLSDDSLSVESIQAFIFVEQQQVLARRARMSKQGQVKVPQKTDIKAISVPVHLE